MTTCDRSRSLVPDLRLFQELSHVAFGRNGWCRDRLCDPILDQDGATKIFRGLIVRGKDICCVPAAFCDGLVCLSLAFRS